MTPWQTISTGAGLESGLGFTCYAPIPSSSSPLDIATLDTRRLLSFLARNQAFHKPGVQDPFSYAETVRAAQEAVYPVSSSSSVAAVLGLLAFKQCRMDVIEFSCEGVILKERPIQHPLGFFWLLSGVALAESIDNGTLKVRKASMEMVIVNLRTPRPHSYYVQQAAKMQLQERKRRLEECIQVAELQKKEDQRELASIQKRLRAFTELEQGDESS